MTTYPPLNMVAPKGTCDFCGTRKATHWFGDTSVALRDADECAEKNAEAWHRLLGESEDIK